MSARIPMFLALLMAGIPAGHAADAGAPTFAPETYGIDRYKQIWKRSPFIVESVVATQSAGLATKYGLVGVAWLNNQPVVFLVDRNEGDPGKGRFMVSKARADTLRNLELVSVLMDKDPRKSSAVIKQGTEQASLPFDASALPQTGPVGVAGGPIPAPPSGGYIPPPPSGIMNPAARMQVPTGQVPPIPNPNAQVPPAPTRRIIRPKPINVN